MKLDLPASLHGKKMIAKMVVSRSLRRMMVVNPSHLARVTGLAPTARTQTLLSAQSAIVAIMERTVRHPLKAPETVRSEVVNANLRLAKGIGLATVAQTAILLGEQSANGVKHRKQEELERVRAEEDEEVGEVVEVADHSEIVEDVVVGIVVDQEVALEEVEVPLEEAEIANRSEVLATRALMELLRTKRSSLTNK